MNIINITFAPLSSKIFIDSGKTSYTTTLCPALIRFSAIGPPMFPKPMKPTGVRVWIQNKNGNVCILFN